MVISWCDVVVGETRLAVSVVCVYRGAKQKRTGADKNWHFGVCLVWFFKCINDIVILN